MIPSQIRIIRSRRRTKTIEARWIGETIEVRAPAHLTDAELRPIIDRLAERLRKKRRRRTPADDPELRKRADALNGAYFNGELRVESIRYVSNQRERFGSCSPIQRTIRLSDRLKKYPSWVVDYVIVHELAHLIHPNHSAAFWKEVNRYPLTERARGFLMAVGFTEDERDASDNEEQVEQAVGIGGGSSG